MKNTHRIALIPGDGIGAEVLPPACAVLDAVARRHGFTVAYDEFDWSCRRYLEVGAMMPDDGLDRIRAHDSILFGAVGWPGVPDDVSLWGLLIPIRREFDQYVNLRPVRTLPGVAGPLRDHVVGEGIDLVVVRENSEGEYSRIGGRLFDGSERELALQESLFTRTGVTRIADYAFELAAERRGRLTSATKSNGIIHTLTFWDEVVAERAALHPDVDWGQEHIDALAAKLVMTPRSFDVIVASNLFGDILSDLAAGIVGSIGVAPSANLNPARDHPSMFEPVHGSAPDIANQGVANPLAAIWSVAMMLDHLGHREAGDEVRDAMFATLGEGRVATRDLGGRATTEEFTREILSRIPSPAGVA